MKGTTMKGDFSRLRFNPAKQYTSVLEQQGRVALDADANEQCFINEYLRDITNYDVIGPVGGPAGSAGFGIRIEGDEILILPGRYYVNGLLVENLSTLRYDKQPYLIGAPTAKDILLALREGGAGATGQFILEVWQRLVTQLDDPCLSEPALGQADTTARLQTVWRVVGAVQTVVQQQTDTAKTTGQSAAVQLLNPTPEGGLVFLDPVREEDPIQVIDPIRGGCASGSESQISSLSSCCQSLYDLKPPAHTGSMGADTGTTGDCGCQPTAPAGYQGLENQLYRVEIHHAGTLETATFKWSRENGSVVTAITGINGPTVTAASLGPDANLGFQAGQWVELSDDALLFGLIPNRSGKLYQIQSVQQAALQVTLNIPVTGISLTNARMRRWDQNSASATADGIPLSATAIPLENGIEVTFGKGDYLAGDYWTIPARAALGNIVWPPCGSVSSKFLQPPGYMALASAPLACIRWRDDDYNYNQETAATAREFYDPARFIVSDCRIFFPPLTALCGNSNPTALQVDSTNWNNDDYMTLDDMVANGLSVTLDQAPSSPITGATFAVTLESTAPAFSLGNATSWYSEGNFPTTVLRGLTVLDTYSNLTTNGSTLSWTLPLTLTDPAQSLVLLYLDALLTLGVTAGWYARVRVRLLGRGIYANGSNGQIYLDGQTFGQAGTRVDGSASVALQFPSGDGEKASDFESWFYLLPIVYIVNVVIQGVENNIEKQVSAVIVRQDSQNNLTLQIGETQSIPVTNLQAKITLNYAPPTPTTISLTLVGNGVGSLISIAQTLNVAAGQTTATTAINILSNPGAQVTNTYTLVASVATALSNAAYYPPPTLAVTGSTPQTNIP
jgi:hypothetical protein